jgi:Fe2+ or Zn2+ uptake regulation protein
MTTPGDFSDHVKTLFRRNGSIVTSSRLRILTVINKQNDTDFSDIDLYRLLQEEKQKVSLSTINKNLKNLNQMGLLVKSKTNLAVTLYRKSGDFKKLLSAAALKLGVFHYQLFSTEHYLFAGLAH